MAGTGPGAIETAITAALAGLSGWKESTFAYEMLGMDGNTLVAKTWAVGLPSTDRTDPKRGRRDFNARTEVRARAVLRIRPDAQRDDITQAYTDELTFAQQLVTLSVVGVSHLAIDRIVRTTVGDGTFRVIEIQAHVQHLYPLS